MKQARRNDILVPATAAVAIPTNQTRVDCTPAAAESDRPLRWSVKVLEMEAKSGVKISVFRPCH